MTDLTRERIHKNTSGGNDYILCHDCGQEWDYRKPGTEPLTCVPTRERELRERAIAALGGGDSELVRVAAMRMAAFTQDEIDRERIEFCNSPCGHSSQYAYSEDGGKNIVCLLCELASARQEERELLKKELCNDCKSRV